MYCIGLALNPDLSRFGGSTLLYSLDAYIRFNPVNQGLDQLVRCYQDATKAILRFRQQWPKLRLLVVRT